MKAMAALSMGLRAMVRSATGRNACSSRRKNRLWARAWAASQLVGATSTARWAVFCARASGSGWPSNPNMYSSAYRVASMAQPSPWSGCSRTVRSRSALTLRCSSGDIRS